MYDDIGQRIKQLRRNQQMTMEELAEQSGYRTASRKTAIYQIEVGKNSVPIDRLPLISSALHTSIYYLLGMTDDPDVTDEDIIAYISKRGEK